VGAEGLVTGNSRPERRTADWDESEDEDDEPRKISPYAQTPLTVRAGLRGAYSSLNRNFTQARDALASIPAEAREAGNVAGAAEAVVRNVPVAVIRPLVGISEAVGSALGGVSNALDGEGERRRGEKYKRY